MAECFQLPTISFCYSDSSVIDMKLMDLDIEPRYIAGPWEGLKSGGARGALWGKVTSGGHLEHFETDFFQKAYFLS